MSRQDLTHEPTNLAAARRERQGSQRRRAADSLPSEDELGQPYVAAADVVALLNRIGECVRALPSFGRTRTQTAAVVAKRTLSAISTCSPSGLADHDELRPVLARLGASRSTLRDEYDVPAHAYVIRNGEVFRELDGEAASDAVGESHEERIEDLARAGAVIAAEIDRLQRHQQRRYA